jgi:hypothetical protein
MAQTTTFRVEGLRELLRVTDQLPKQIRRDVRNELRNTATAIRDEAQSLFLTEVSPDVKKTRYGITVRRVGLCLRRAAREGQVRSEVCQT